MLQAHSYQKSDVDYLVMAAYSLQLVAHSS